MMKAFRKTTPEWVEFGKSKGCKCEDAKNCRLCNNYYGSELDAFDCKVERAEAMPSVRCIEVEGESGHVGRKR